MENKEKTCCFVGHRKILETAELKIKLYEIIEKLILDNEVERFLFGSKSDFDKLCLSVVTELKDKYPHIKRIYVRAEFPYIDDEYKAYLLESYEDTYFSEKILNAGKAVYIKRNYEMIDKSDFCIIYYNKNYSPQRKSKSSSSGTKIAYEYACKKCNVINLFKNTTL